MYIADSHAPVLTIPMPPRYHLRILPFPYPISYPIPISSIVNSLTP
jgi:hypothetical protein